jgi:hypothetical protein
VHIATRAAHSLRPLIPTPRLCPARARPFYSTADFKSVPEMTAFLSSATTKPDVKAAWCVSMAACSGCLNLARGHQAGGARRAELSLPPLLAPCRADVHKLGTVMRMAVPLTPANAKVAKERGAITP